MRRFNDGDTIEIEPWRARAFPVLKDLVVDRSALDRIVAAGGYNSINAGNAPDASAILVPKQNADKAMDAAACIGCGACVAACPNASAALFTSAKIAHFALLPQGQPERERRAEQMILRMDEEGFGHCTNIFECEAACPVGVSVENITRMYREFMRATFKP
jgi:succinate dehydrogenase / fumarate reductase iron-sulfur subunit